jgi:tetratricopeptide (TPR) repeat protein
MKSRHLTPFLLLSILGVGACDMLGSKSVSALRKVVKPIGTAGSEATTEDVKLAAEKVNITYYYLLGLELAAQGRTDDALVALERVRALDDSSAHVHLALAQEYLKSGRTKEGVAFVRKAIELDPKSREGRLLLANLHTLAKKEAEALAVYRELLKENPDDEEVFLYVVLAELEAKQVTSARRKLQDYLARNPDSALGHFYLGRLEQERGDLTAAAAAFRRAIESRGGFVQAGTYLGYVLEQLGRKDEALDTYSWLAEQTDSAAFHQRLGQLYLEKGDYERSLRAFQNYERVDPSDFNNKIKVGLLLVELKQLEPAAAKFREILKTNPDSDNVRYYLGAVLEELERPAEALAEYRRIPETSRLYADALRRQVTSLQSTKNTDEAWTVLKKALAETEKDKGPTENLFETAILFLSNNKRPGEAWDVLRQAMSRFPDSESLLYMKGTLFEKEGKHDEAVGAMKELLRRNPNHAGALNFVGYLWADRNENLPEAEKMIRRALKLRPNDPFMTDSLGWVLYRRGKYEEARQALELAHRGAPKESIIADHLGDVLVKLGRLEEAKAYYELALKLGPEKDSERQSLEAKLQGLRSSMGASCLRDADPACAGGLRDAKRTPASTH